MTTHRAVFLSTAALIAVCLAAFLITRLTLTEPDTATGSTVSSTAPAATTTSLPPAIPGPTSTSSTPSSNPGDSRTREHADDHAEDPDVNNEQAWNPVVTNFARNFTNTAGGNRAWRNRLIDDPAQPHVTTAVAKQLATVDVDNVPAGRYDRYQPVQTSTLDVAVKVDYTEGWSMILHLNTDGTNWQIYAYDRYEG